MKIIFLGIICICVFTGRSIAQETDSTARYPQGKAYQKKNDPKNSMRWSTRKNKLDNMVKIDSTSLPDEVKRRLKSDQKYFGWQKGYLYKTKEGDMYIVEFNKGKEKKQYRFGTQGNTIDY